MALLENIPHWVCGFKCRLVDLLWGFQDSTFDKHECRMRACMLRLLVSLAEPKSEAGVWGGSQAFGVNSLGIYNDTRRKQRSSPGKTSGQALQELALRLVQVAPWELGGWRGLSLCGHQIWAVPWGQEPGLEWPSCLSCYRNCRHTGAYGEGRPWSPRREVQSSHLEPRQKEEPQKTAERDFRSRCVPESGSVLELSGIGKWRHVLSHLTL